VFMLIVPVVDIRKGTPVQARAGKRTEYHPLDGWDARTGSLPVLLQRWRELFGSNCFYVADLDGIMNAEPQWEALHRLSLCGGQFWLDSGIRTKDCLGRVLALPNVQPVIGTETAANLREMIEAALGVQVIVSVDLSAGRLVIADTSWAAVDVYAFVCGLLDLGVRRILILDIAAVGMGQGVPTLPLCRQLKLEFPELFLITGGGVRSPDCLLQARDAGVDALLVASALHDGRITPEDISRVTGGKG
jgi:phosphoribosylformimino-5-aminoimidazole carboxamide ribotide isomerase